MTKNSRKKKAIRVEMAATGEPYMEARRRSREQNRIVNDPDSVAVYSPFPEEGTEECGRWHSMFRAGKIILGPASGDHEAIIDLNKAPHTLVGGGTGTGKTMLMMLVLYGALMNPDEIDLIVVDPKITDFTWTRGYPNVKMYAVRDVRTLGEEIHVVTECAVKAMNVRLALLREHGVGSLTELRDGVRSGTITGITPDEVPKRLVLLFDECGAAFTPVKDPVLKAMQDAARTNMESIGMLARTTDINIVMTSQRPSANVSALLRAQCGNRIAFGQVGGTETRRWLGIDLATQGHDGAPKGRGWLVEEGQALLFQSYFMPKRNTPDLAGTDRTIAGVLERVATRLEEAGWTPINHVDEVTFINDEGEPVVHAVNATRWVRL